MNEGFGHVLEFVSIFLCDGSPIFVCMSFIIWQMLDQFLSVCLLLVFVTDRQTENYREGQS